MLNAIGISQQEYSSVQPNAIGIKHQDYNYAQSAPFQHIQAIDMHCAQCYTTHGEAEAPCDLYLSWW